MSRTISSISAFLILTCSIAAGSEIKANTTKSSPDWDFNRPYLGTEWTRLGTTASENISLTERSGFLRLKPASDSDKDEKTQVIVGRRQKHVNFQTSTRLEASADAVAGVSAYISPSVHCDLYLKDGKLHLSRTADGKTLDEIIDTIPGGSIEIKVKGTPESYCFSYLSGSNGFREAGTIDRSQLLSGENTNKTDAYISLFAKGKGHADFDYFKYREVIPEISPKLTAGHGNPLLDFHFTADPTAVEHDGRLYVYATNDHQQYEAVGRDGKNTYDKIKSLVMMSTDDMVNWTYHGLINVGDIAPWIIASWAPSIAKRVEADGKTHFYLYFSNSGFGTGVLTATSPVGPWTSPLSSSLIDANTPGLGDCKVPFDPGVTIDDNGTGWLAVGAGKARIIRLGKDMTSIDSEITEMPAPHHFEANEINYINGTYVYTYNVDWQSHNDWPFEGEEPTICSMCYMSSKTPLDPKSWTYHHNYLKNSGDYGYAYTNNHTHLHKYMDRWFIFYHSMELQNSFNTDGGFRNVCVDEIDVDEDKLHIAMGSQTLHGPSQLKPLNPFALQQSETTAATHGVGFIPAGDKAGNMTAVVTGNDACIKVKGVAFDKKARSFHVKAGGKGTIEVRKGSADGELLSKVNIDTTDATLHKQSVKIARDKNPCDLYFVLKGDNITFDWWQFK